MDLKKKNGNSDMIIYVILAALMIVGWHFASGTAFNSGEAKLPVNFNLLLYVSSITGVLVLATVLFFLSDSIYLYYY